MIVEQKASIRRPASFRLAAAAATSCLLCVCLLCAGCPGKGKVHLTLDLPETEKLNPIEDEGLREFRLQVRRGNEVESLTATWGGAQPGFSFGDLDPGHIDMLALSGYTLDGRLLCYGRTGPVEIPDGGETTAHLAVRRPITYLTGASDVKVFDTSRDREKQLLDSIGAAGSTGRTLSVAMTPDGRYALVLADEPPRLIVVTTRNHTIFREHSLSGSPKYMSVSADGRWAAVCDPLSTSGNIAIYDVNQLINNQNPQPATTGPNLDRPPEGIPAFVRLADGQERVAVLGNRLGIRFECPTDPIDESVLYLIDPYEGTIAATINLSAGARAVAAGPGSSYVFVALPCNQEVRVIDPNTRQKVSSFTASKPTALVMSAPDESNTFLFVGNANETTPAKLVINTIDLAAAWNGESSIDYYKERVHLQAGPDAELTLTVEPESVRVTRMSAPPGQQRLSLLVYAKYSSQQFEWGQSTVPETITTTRAYVSLDRTSGELGGRYRAYCRVEEGGSGCADVDLGLQPVEDFIPSGIATIYGSQ